MKDDRFMINVSYIAAFIMYIDAIMYFSKSDVIGGIIWLIAGSCFLYNGFRKSKNAIKKEHTGSINLTVEKKFDDSEEDIFADMRESEKES